MYGDLTSDLPNGKLLYYPLHGITGWCFRTWVCLGWWALGGTDLPPKVGPLGLRNSSGTS